MSFMVESSRRRSNGSEAYRTNYFPVEEPSKIQEVVRIKFAHWIRAPVYIRALRLRLVLIKKLRPGEAVESLVRLPVDSRGLDDVYANAEVGQGQSLGALQITTVGIEDVP